MNTPHDTSYWFFSAVRQKSPHAFIRQPASHKAELPPYFNALWESIGSHFPIVEVEAAFSDPAEEVKVLHFSRLTEDEYLAMSTETPLPHIEASHELSELQ